jgi:hypothetical protein
MMVEGILHRRGIIDSYIFEENDEDEDDIKAGYNKEGLL